MKVKELAERHSVTSVILEVRKEIRTEEGEREKRYKGEGEGEARFNSKFRVFFNVNSQFPLLSA